MTRSYDSIVKNEGTFKFLNGKGETTHILTNASVPQLIVDLNNAKNKGSSRKSVERGLDF